MARLSQEKIDEIRQSVDIVDVMGQYLELHKKGKNYMAICPFHDDNHPSLSIHNQDRFINVLYAATEGMFSHSVLGIFKGSFRRSCYESGRVWTCRYVWLFTREACCESR